MSSLAPHDLWELGIIGGCLVLSAFFSGSETAITSLGSLKAKHLIDSKARGSRHLLLWLHYPERVLTTILIFNNVVNILASAVATDLATRYFASQAIGIATGSVTFLVLIFGEIIPKSFAKAHAESLSVMVMRVINMIYTVVFPIVWVLSSFANLIVRLFGGDKSPGPPITEEELEFLVNVGERAGVLEGTKKDMIVGVFEFDETKVREVMTPRPDIVTIKSSCTFDEALEVAIGSGFSRIPVYDHESGIDHILGVLLVKDLLAIARSADQDNESKPFDVKKILRDPVFIPESKLIIDIFRDLKRNKNHIAIVVDEHGGTAGLVTMEDILEEIVGEIQDEYDAEEAEVLELEDGVYDVAGSINIDNFLETFNLSEDDIPQEREEDVDTVAGWITTLGGNLPEVGTKFRLGPLLIEVTDVEKQRVQRLRVSKQPTVFERKS